MEDRGCAKAQDGQSVIWIMDLSGPGSCLNIGSARKLTGDLLLLTNAGVQGMASWTWPWHVSEQPSRQVVARFNEDLSAGQARVVKVTRWRNHRKWRTLHHGFQFYVVDQRQRKPKKQVWLRKRGRDYPRRIRKPTNLLHQNVLELKFLSWRTHWLISKIRIFWLLSRLVLSRSMVVEQSWNMVVIRRMVVRHLKNIVEIRRYFPLGLRMLASKREHHLIGNLRKIGGKKEHNHTLHFNQLQHSLNLNGS